MFTPNLKKGKASNDLSQVEVADFGKKSPSIFQSLYEESKAREAKKKERQVQSLRSSITDPAVNQISREIVGDKSFQERQKAYDAKRVEKERQRKEQDEKENAVLHRPKVNSKGSLRQLQVPIGEHLYSQAQKASKTGIGKDSKTGIGKDSRPTVNRKSEKVYEERKVVAFYQIFKLLDEDEDGAICSASIDLEALPREIVKIIYPLLEELDTMEVQLEEHEFIGSLHNLFQTLSVHERNVVLGFTPSIRQP